MEERGGEEGIGVERRERIGREGREGKGREKDEWRGDKSGHLCA